MTPDMADAHATARARDARVEESFEERAERYGLDWDVVAHLMSEQPTRRAYRTRTQAIDPETGEFTPLTQEPDMTKHDRHDELVALLRRIADTLDGFRGAPDLPTVLAANLEAIEHEVETPMRGHGECCEPADITEEPPVGSQVTDREGDVWERRENGWTWWARDRWLLIRRSWESVVRDAAPLRFTTDEDRKRVGLPVDPAPADVDPDEALARVIFGDAFGSHEGLRLAQLDVALMAREHIEAEQEEVVATLREEVAIQTARAEQAEVWMSKWQQSCNDARDERDALRERLDALREDVERFSAGDPLITPLDILARDDERAAKGGQR